MLRRDLAQALQVALRRHQHAGGARHRLDDHRRDGLGAVERHQPLEVVGEIGAVLGLALHEGVAGEVVGVAQVVDAREEREHPAVVDEPPDRDAAEADAVIAALAPDHPGPGALADGALVGERDLERGIDRFRARAGEEHPVERAGRRDGGETLGELEGDRVAHLERGRVVEGRELALDGLGDAPAAVPGIDAPQAGGAVEDGAPVIRRVVHALGRHEQARRRLELAVGRERHPVGVEARAVEARRMGVHGGGLRRGRLGRFRPQTRPFRHGQQVLFWVGATL